jgi:7-carboxy-7-deazaguanine synthase
MTSADAKQYLINDIFYSLQGEGVRAGEPSFFLRFSKCNQICLVATHGFDCDTEFASGRRRTADEIIADMKALSTRCQWIVLTGGEPSLQVDDALIAALHDAGYKFAIETNGSRALADGLDWITVSPKVAEHAIRQKVATEVKYVRNYGQGIPKTVVQADYYLVSPAFSGDDLDGRVLEWCIELVRENPGWRLSCQQHKFWRVR